MARVGSFSSRAHADVAAGMLTARGIPARTDADDAGGAAPHVAIGAHGFAVEVPDHRAAEARDLLADTEEQDAHPRPTGGWHPVLRATAWLVLGTIVLGFVWSVVQ